MCVCIFSFPNLDRLSHRLLAAGFGDWRVLCHQRRVDADDSPHVRGRRQAFHCISAVGMLVIDVVRARVVTAVGLARLAGDELERGERTSEVSMSAMSMMRFESHDMT